MLSADASRLRVGTTTTDHMVGRRKGLRVERPYITTGENAHWYNAATCLQMGDITLRVVQVLQETC